MSKLCNLWRLLLILFFYYYLSYTLQTLHNLNQLDSKAARIPDETHTMGKIYLFRKIYINLEPVAQFRFPLKSRISKSVQHSLSYDWNQQFICFWLGNTIKL